MKNVNSDHYDRRRHTRAVATIGSKIKTLRLARGMTVTDLARAVGIAQPSLSNIEAGKTKTIRGSTLAGFCRVLGTSPEMLLKGSASTDEGMLLEAELLGLWRTPDEGQREHVMAVIPAIAAAPKSPAALRHASEASLDAAQNSKFTRKLTT